MGKLAFLLQLIVVGIITLSITGCDGRTGYRLEASEPGYQILTVKNKLVSFSLDYSTYYEIERPHMDADNIRPATFVNLVAPRKEMKMIVPDFNEGGNVKTVSVSYCPAGIDIYIYAAT